MDNFKYYDEMTDEEKEDFIEDLVKHYDEFTTSDLQGVIMARTFKKDRTLFDNMQECDEVLNIVYEKIDKRGEK